MAYTVTDVREVSDLTPGGAVRRRYRVWLTTARGASGTLDVSEADYTAEQLPALLEQRAAELDLAFEVAAG